MVQIIQRPMDRRLALSEQLGMSLGQGLGQGLNTYYANKALDDVINDKELQDKPQSVKMSRLQQALSPYGETGMSIINQRLQIEQQERLEKQQESISKVASGKDLKPDELKHLSPENQFKYYELQKKKQAGKSIRESLLSAGYPEETADIWQNQMENSPTGGQSDIIKQVNNLISRSKTGKGLGSETEEKQTLKPSIEIPGIESEELELDFPELPEPVGLTPADIVKQNEHREKINAPLYAETIKHVNALDEEYRDLQHLNELDATGKLPVGSEKWNVDWDTGDLRVKALATPEAQDYVKTIARMARKAKDFFPGRVTNFDLQQFKNGFSTLANSPEGRKIISEQLILSNRIAYLQDETVKAAIDHYGSGADPVQVRRFAQDNYRRLKGKLESQLKEKNKMADQLINSQNKTQGKPLEQATTLDEVWI